MTTGQPQPLGPQPVVEALYTGDQPGVASLASQATRSARGLLSRRIAASSGHGLRSPTWAHCVKWSQTPRPRQVRESLFVVLAGSPGAAALRGPGAAGGSLRGRPGQRSAGPRRCDGSARPRLARRATRSGCGDLSDAAGRAALVGWVAARVEFQEKLPDRSSGGVSGCRGSGPRRGPRDRDPRQGSSQSVRGGRGPATRRMLGVP
jgi:hypothetical protein